MNLLRRLTTTRLLALVTAVCAMVAASVAIANAVQGQAEPPPGKPLAQAIHDAIAAEPVSGISARIELKNDLIDAGGFEGVSPLITGGDGRLWWSDDERFRLELQGQSGDVQLVVDKRAYWLYDGNSNTVYRGTLAPDSGKQRRAERVPTVAEIEQRMRRVLRRVGIAGPEPGVEAGRPAYNVKISPKRNGGLIGAAGIAWDAVTGTALRAGIYPKGSDEPVIELKATEIEYGPVDDGAFGIEPPPGAEVVELETMDPNGHGSGKRGKKKSGERSHSAADIDALRDRLAFDLKAPPELAGRTLRGGHELVTKRGSGAVLVYGEGLDAIWVLQRPYVPKTAQPKKDDDFGHENQSLALPTTEIGGARATVLATPLGSALEWSNHGVTYAVAGSVPRATAEAAARGLD